MFVLDPARAVRASPILKEGEVRAILPLRDELVYLRSNQDAMRLDIKSPDSSAERLPFPSSVGKWAYDSGASVLWVPTDKGIFKYHTGEHLAKQ